MSSCKTPIGVLATPFVSSQVAEQLKLEGSKTLPPSSLGPHRSGR